jgi:hypothetical protein
MAKIKKNNPILHGLSGMLGGMVVFSQMPDGSTRVSVRPASRGRKRAPGERENQNRFKIRTAWAKAASKGYPIYAELARDMPMINAYNLAISDYAHPPVIHCVERKEGVIRVQASDNIFVASVHVWIRDENGNELEDGEATRVDDASGGNTPLPGRAP